jgi:hypothetical protein
MRRRTFVAASAAAFAASTCRLPVARSEDGQPVRLGLVADPQYADIDTWNTRFYRQSIDKLSEAIDAFNSQKLHACVNLGDLIDKQWASYDTIFEPIKRSVHPFYHVLGNHDFDLMDEYKSQVPHRLGMPRRYYHTSVGSWVLAFLDTTDVSLFAQPSEQPEYAVAEKQLQGLKDHGAKHAQTWNGAVGSKQMEWLQQICRTASERQHRVIIFSHHPIYPDNAHNVWNSEQLLAFVEKNRTIVAWLNGHNHAGNFGMFNDIPFVTLHGMVETKDTNAYATLDLLSDRIVVTGYGREPSREIRLRT